MAVLRDRHFRADVGGQAACAQYGSGHIGTPPDPGQSRRAQIDGRSGNGWTTSERGDDAAGAPDTRAHAARDRRLAPDRSRTRSWMRSRPFGPADHHFLRDLGTFQAGIGIALLVAAGRPSWRAPILFAALAGARSTPSTTCSTSATPTRAGWARQTSSRWWGSPRPTRTCFVRQRPTSDPGARGRRRRPRDCPREGLPGRRDAASSAGACCRDCWRRDTT